jgi:lysophospholipase L1-like esterase
MIDSIFDRVGTVHRTSSLMVADPMPRRIPLHRQIIFLSIPYLLFALALVGFEGATRLFLPHIPPLDVLIESPAVRPDLAEFKDSPVFMADPLLFWRVRPNLKEVVWDFTVVSTNSQGWRHETDIGRKPSGAFRIVCLGDSVTFGFRVPLVFPDKPHDYARDLLPYPLLLERRLREMNPGKPIDVIPLAVPAYTTYQGLNLLRREIDLLKPDVVTACFGWNDICLRPVPDRQSMPIDWAHVAVRSLMCHSQALIHFSRWSRKAKANRPSPGPPVPRVSTQDYVANLLQIAALARARGAEVVLIAPVYRDAQANPPEAALIRQYRNALHEAAQANGVPYIQIEELTETNYPANDNLFGEVIHPNADGHAIMARELLKFLSAHDMLKSLKVPQSP